MKLKFLPTGKEIEITPEKTLLQVSLENQVDIKSICKGKLICAECRVKVVEGEANCLPPTRAELSLLGTAWQLESCRLACQVRCFGDVTIDMTEQIQRDETNRKKIRGFKSDRPASESHAVIDTMLLNEKIPEGKPERAGDGGEAGAERGANARPDRGQDQGPRRQQGGSSQNQKGEHRDRKGGGGRGRRGNGNRPRSQ